jgi:hypothetical protein
MSTYEEKAQIVLDLRAQVLDPNQPNPSPEEVWEAVNGLHATRGTVASKKAATTPIIDLASLFAPKPEEKDETPSA